MLGKKVRIQKTNDKANIYNKRRNDALPANGTHTVKIIVNSEWSMGSPNP